MTTTTIQSINDNGIAQIAAWLLVNHKLGKRISQDPAMLRAWAADAEFSLREGNDAGVEIRRWDSIHGRTQTFTVSAEGINSTEIEINE